jgi:predicted oxidoreductase
MKVRNGYVSNSSSSSFVLLKDAISNNQLDMILNIEEWIEIIIKEDEENGSIDKLREKFEYYDSDPWRISDYGDYIFGETSMDNFSMSDYLNHIKVDRDYICWDDGYNDEPYQNQLEFIRNLRQKLRKNKINKINDL